MSAPHTVLRTWLRTVAGEPPRETDGLELVAGEGVAGDHARGTKRHVTLLLEDDWRAALADLGHNVEPSRRRANVLLSGGNAGALIGRTLQLGGATIVVRGETAPCHVMDAAAHGLRAALEPHTRAGVWAEVTSSGRVAPGDTLRA